MHEDGSREESGGDILLARDLRNCSITIYASMVFSGDGVLLGKGGGGTRHLTDAPFGEGLLKAGINARISADAGTRLMPVRRGRVVKVDCHAGD